MVAAYERLHALGFAHSAEAWREGELVGGLYGVSLGGCFFGESMFTRAPDASKTALVTLLRQLDAWGFTLFDCQTHTPHVERLGAPRLATRNLSRGAGRGAGAADAVRTLAARRGDQLRSTGTKRSSHSARETLKPAALRCPPPPKRAASSATSNSPIE